jgi:tetrapyrrole methylase family protein/MazG family protein
MNTKGLHNLEWSELKQIVKTNNFPDDPVKAFERLYTIISILRSPEGCSWDKSLQYSDLQQNLVEESFELIDGIRNNNTQEMREELGDVYLVITMLGRILEESSIFTLADSLHEVSEKLIRRHPHVFTHDSNLSSEQVKVQWEAIKRTEKDPHENQGYLHKIGQGLHPLDKAAKIQRKVSKVGFDWPSVQGVLGKIEEELQEVRDEILKAEVESESNEKRLKEELGDLLFSVVNLVRYLGFSPTLLLHQNLEKFTERFHYVESEMKKEGLKMNTEHLDRMEKHWQDSKKIN